MKGDCLGVSLHNNILCGFLLKGEVIHSDLLCKEVGQIRTLLEKKKFGDQIFKGENVIIFIVYKNILQYTFNYTI